MRPPRWLIRLLGRVQTPIYRITRGRVAGRVRGAEVILLTTTGRRSGRARTVPLLSIRDGDRFVVVASQGGHDAHPAWWLNLRADPGAVIEVRGRRIGVIARKLGDADADALWPRLVAAYPPWEEYRSRTDRAFPVIALKPTV